VAVSSEAASRQCWALQPQGWVLFSGLAAGSGSTEQSGPGALSLLSKQWQLGYAMHSSFAEELHHAWRLDDWGPLAQLRRFCCHGQISAMAGHARF
jgi:hypothetical protein